MTSAFSFLVYFADDSRDLKKIMYVDFQNLILFRISTLKLRAKYIIIPTIFFCYSTIQRFNFIKYRAKFLYMRADTSKEMLDNIVLKQTASPILLGSDDVTDIKKKWYYTHYNENNKHCTSVCLIIFIFLSVLVYSSRNIRSRKN